MRLALVGLALCWLLAQAAAARGGAGSSEEGHGALHRPGWYAPLRAAVAEARCCGAGDLGVARHDLPGRIPSPGFQNGTEAVLLHVWVKVLGRPGRLRLRGLASALSLDRWGACQEVFCSPAI